MIYLFYDKYNSLDDVVKLKAETKKEALIKVINYVIENELITIDSIIDCLDLELKALDDIKNVE